MLIIGAYYLYDALQAYLKEELETALYYSIMGIVGVAAAIYIARRFRKKSFTSAISISPKVVTALECEKCGLKNLRDFVKGDHVMKRVEDCQQCNEPMLITSIYTEKPEK
jgi:hypothetical protein